MENSVSLITDLNSEFILNLLSETGPWFAQQKKKKKKRREKQQPQNNRRNNSIHSKSPLFFKCMILIPSLSGNAARRWAR